MVGYAQGHPVVGQRLEHCVDVPVWSTKLDHMPPFGRQKLKEVSQARQIVAQLGRQLRQARS